jgi:hypothetical protein
LKSQIEQVLLQASKSCVATPRQELFYYFTNPAHDLFQTTSQSYVYFQRVSIGAIHLNSDIEPHAKAQRGKELGESEAAFLAGKVKVRFPSFINSLCDLATSWLCVTF